MCRQCGALVGAGQSHCMMCDAPSTPSPAARGAGHAATTSDPETLRFIRAIISRPATFTIIFITANVFLYVLMALSGGAMGDVLEAYGAKVNRLIEAGQWWRFVTPIFLHVNVPGLGPLHLLVNMYSLFMLGPYVEKLYGSARFVVFWVVTGVGGTVASYLTVRPDMQVGAVGRFLFKNYDVPSAGASGALFGLVGVLFVFGIKYRDELPEGFKRAFGTGMIPTILINLFIGYTIPFIDNAAHLGGFVAGALLALFVGYKRPGQSASVAVFWHVLQFAALALVVVSFGQVARHLDGFRPSFSDAGGSVPGSPSAAVTAQAASYLNAIKKGTDALAPAINDGNADAAVRAIADLDTAPRLEAEADKLRDDLKLLLARARDYAPINQKKKQTPREEAQGAQLVKDIASWSERYLQWVDTKGKDYGIERTVKAAPSTAEETEKQPPPRQGK